MRGLRLAFTITLLLGGLFSPSATEAQQSAKVARIGCLAGDMIVLPRVHEAFRQGLRDLGYVEGRTVVIENRDAEGKFERLPALAAELVALKVDVIVAADTPATVAAKKATQAVPIVFTAAGDPVGSGLVTSLARPGGNVTGVTNQALDLLGKRLELLTQAVSGVSRIAVLLHPEGLGGQTARDMRKEVDAAGRTLKARLQVVEARGPDDLDRAFSKMTSERASALVVLPATIFLFERRRLADLAAKHRIPAMYSFRDFVEVGGLISYGPDVADLFRRAATHVDKILKGARPGGLPVEQPTKFEMAINLKTAKALDLTIPPSLLARADHVVEK
jgi:putative ABC transport system substrate-binding protein